MSLITLETIDQYCPGLTEDQKRPWLDAYDRVSLACVAAGVSNEQSRHATALHLASSKVYNDSASVVRLDSIYSGEWPHPGKGAPRNPYGGFSTLDYPGDREGWHNAWVLYLAGLKDVEAFARLEEWIWALNSAIEDPISFPNIDDIEMRDGDLPAGEVRSKPSDYGNKAWQKPPDGISKIEASLPTVDEFLDLYRIYWAERKRKELDGILGIEDAISQCPWDGIKESAYTIEQLGRAVPEAILAWAKKQAKDDGRDLVKEDLELRYKNPEGTVNYNGIRAARQCFKASKLPADVKKAAWDELEQQWRKARKALGKEDVVDGQYRENYAEIRIVRYDEAQKLLIADIPIAKLTVLPYQNADGVVTQELKHPQDFATASFLASIPGKPLVDTHRPDGDVSFNEMEPRERARYTVGLHHVDATMAWVEDDLIYARSIVFEPQMIADIRSEAKNQVSTGIRTLVVEEEGEFKGLKYTHRQTQPILDHTAFVPLGRCGSDCAVPIRLDGAVEITNDEAGGTQMSKEKKQDLEKPAPKGESTALSLKIDETEIVFGPEVKAEDVTTFQGVIDALNQAKTDAEAKVAELEKAHDTVRGSAAGKDVIITTLQDEVKVLKDSQKVLDEGLESRFDERKEVIDFARKLDSDYDYHGKTTQQVRADAVKLLDPDADLEGKSKDYVQAAFDSLRKVFDRQEQEPVGDHSLRIVRKDEAVDDKVKPGARTDAIWRDPDAEAKAKAKALATTEAQGGAKE